MLNYYYKPNQPYERHTMTTTTTYPASEKQVALIARLLAERVTPETFESKAKAPDLDKATASAYIDALFAAPRKPAVHEDGDALGEGYYWVEGLVYKVQASKSTGNLYAKVFTAEGYDYAPGAMRVLKSATRLTLEQAAEMGVKTGRCVVCARLLTDPDSVAAGIGPICAGRL